MPEWQLTSSKVADGVRLVRARRASARVLGAGRAVASDLNGCQSDDGG